MENEGTNSPGVKHDSVVSGVSLLTDVDIFLFNEGNHFTLYNKMGAHKLDHNGLQGVFFAVWAPGADRVSVMGSFNDWNKESHLLLPRGSSGIWEGFIPDLTDGIHYKFHIHSRSANYSADKADPFAYYTELAPQTASVIWGLDYQWHDTRWMASQHVHNGLEQPIAIYELHPGSWMRVPEEGDRMLTWRELAPRLIDYVHQLGFTHVEFLPVTEHPFYGSWGYQCLGYFSPTSRYGRPQDFMFLVDELHRNDIGVILDWVPSHFPSDVHGLGYFDGTHLFEHEDPRQGFHPDWNSYIFNYGRNEVRSFLISSAQFWLEKYHVDGIRVDAVASMLYLDYSRRQGEWIPNQYGGRENLEAIAFLQQLNDTIHHNYPAVLTIAEESTAWPNVSRPVYSGGLGFNMKWDMGWMHDTLQYMSKEPVHRSYHHANLSFRMMYAFSENFVLPFSHDEVVHGKGSLIGKLPGDEWQKFANLRLLLGYMYAQPGKKLMFMGGEFGQFREWSHDRSLDWHLLDQKMHRGVQRWMEDLNQFYRHQPAMHEGDFSPSGFSWIDCNDALQSTLSLLRVAIHGPQRIVAICNFTPLPRYNYRVGVSRESLWQESLNSDSYHYGGSNQGNQGDVIASPVPSHGYEWSLNLVLPPLAIIFLTAQD